MSPTTYLRVLAILTFLLLIPNNIRAQTPTIPRPEHPRPDIMRADWQTLNGRWEFEFDDADRGLAERWYRCETIQQNDPSALLLPEQAERHCGSGIS